jgi:hypothetical protein
MVCQISPLPHLFPFVFTPHSPPLLGRFSAGIHGTQLIKARVEQTTSGLKKAFSEDPPNLVAAKELAIQLKYWQGLETAAKEWSPSS